MSNDGISNSHTFGATDIPVSRGILVVVSSPSGGGKGTLIRRARKLVPDLGYSVSFTTRAPREGEIDGQEYFFVSMETFAAMVEAGEFLEWAIVHGNYYGTARNQVLRDISSGRDIILEIDVQGAEAVREAALEAVAIFILPPSFEVLKSRLRGRGSEIPDDFALRLRNARDEVRHFVEFDYVIINDVADRAAGELAAIVIAERTRTRRQKLWAGKVIETFPT
jgi:guanylate kinase